MDLRNVACCIAFLVVVSFSASLVAASDGDQRVVSIRSTVEPSSLRILHLTDLHYDELYTPGAPTNCELVVPVRCCRAHDVVKEPSHPASKWGDYSCDTPLYLIEQSFVWMAESFAANASLKPDFIIWTGDDPSHNDANQTMESNLRAISTLTGLIKKYFPGIPCFPVLGNHDTWPVDQLDVGNKWLLSPVTDLWADWLDEPAQASFRHGGYYSMLIRPGWRIIGLNSLYYERINFLIAHNISEEDAAGQWAWFVDTLQNARAAGEKVWIISHIAAGSSEAFEDFTIRYQFAIQSFAPDVVTGQFFGHSHRDEFYIIPKGDEDTAEQYRSHLVQSSSIPMGFHKNPVRDITVSGIMFLAPSLMPDYANPSFRMYTYDPDTTQMTDWIAYYADLNETIANDAIEYKVLYSLKDGYGMKDTSPASFADLVYTMWTNSTVFDEYRIRKSAGVPVDDCDVNCHLKTMCNIQYVTDADRAQCSGSLGVR